MIELLAPAGDEKSFYTAINAGANAVYLGLKEFSARRNAENFTADNISYYICYAHAVGVKVYVAVNTLIKDSEMQSFLNCVSSAYSAGADAFILQDIFLGKILKDLFPNIVLHLSTQAGINETYGAKIAKDYGFERVILARETPLSEIKKITQIIETETFAHGALCTCFSGHCYMSSFVGGNSGNRGLCKQPCRKEYKLENSSLKGNYPISLSDLCLANEVKTLIQAGVKSVKIEGRMRSPEYVYSAVKLYRKAIDGQDYSLSQVKRTFNRGDYTLGYLYGADKNIISAKIQNHAGEKVGVVLAVKKDEIKTDRFNREGDGFKIISNGFEVGNAICVKDGYYLKFKGKAKVGDSVSLTKDSSLLNLLNEEVKKKKIDVTAKIEVGKKIKLSSSGITVESESEIQEAKNAPTSEEEIIANLLKTDKYPFEVSPTVEIIGKPFIAKSVLNKVRSTLYEKLFIKDVKPFKNIEFISDFTNNYELHYDRIILAERYAEIIYDAFVLHPNDYKDVAFISEQLKNVLCDKFIFVPAFLPEKDKMVIENLLELFDGVYADGLSGITLAKKYGKKLILGLGVNIFNSITVENAKNVSQDIVLSQELSFKEIENLPKNSGSAFTFGSIRLMELLYCPFGGDCKNCKRKGNFFTLTDEMGRKFKVRRYRIGDKCRFEIYNEQLLLADKNFKSKFINLIGVDGKIIKLYEDNDIEKIKILSKTTYGNLKRGVN